MAIKNEAFFKELGARVARARKEQGMTQQQVDAIAQLPKARQKFVADMLDTVIAQHDRAGQEVSATA